MTYKQLISLCKRERIRKHISLTELEKISGVKESTLSRFENRPDKRSIYALMPYIEHEIIIVYGGSLMDKQEKKTCVNCKHLEISGCYGECGIAEKGVVRPDDSCGKWEAEHDG